MTAILLFILLVIVAVVVAVIINQSRAELGSRAEDILLEQARVAELKAELERAEVEEREELAALRLEMQILEKENAKNVLTLEKELIASGLKGKDAEDALRKELEETRLAEQVKVMAIQLQLDKVKTQEQNKVKTIQFELDKSQARIGLMEANVEKLKNKPIAEIADLKKKLSEANLFTKDLQTTVEKKTTESSEAAKELKAIQDDLNTLKKIEADKRATLQNRLGDSTDTIEDLEEENVYLKNQVATFAAEKAAAKKAADKKAAAKKAAADKKAAAEKAAADKIAAEKAAAKKIAAEKAAADKIAAEKAAAQKKADDKAKIVAIAGAVKKALALKEERERIAAEKAEAERIAAVKKAAEIKKACDRDQGGIQVPPCPDSKSNVINGKTYNRGFPTVTNERLLYLYKLGQRNQMSMKNISNAHIEMEHRKLYCKLYGASNSPPAFRKAAPGCIAK